MGCLRTEVKGGYEKISDGDADENAEEDKEEAEDGMMMRRVRGCRCKWIMWHLMGENNWFTRSVLTRKLALINAN